MMEEETKMLNCKNMIEKIWWAIPPVVVLFVFMPLQIYFNLRKYHLAPFSMGTVINEWVFHISQWFADPLGMIFVVLIIGFMGIGYYIAIRKSLLLRIVVPTMLGIMGFYVGYVILLLMRMH
ncbi:MAG: hypothetical protein DRG33_07115 [Deltaproteobacteria bacterium]|nr:MAG: hypothetical protein DRG33_07115 [Deltaproteobacteria bacterium]